MCMCAQIVFVLRSNITVEPRYRQCVCVCACVRACMRVCVHALFIVNLCVQTYIVNIIYVCIQVYYVL